MRLKLLSIVFCLGCNIKANAQLKFGFELNAYSSVLKNISPDAIVRWGHSGAMVTTEPSFRIAPVVVLRKNISKNLSLETGLGYIHNKYAIRLRHDYVNDNFYRRPIDTTLNISLKYIQIPVSVLYSIPLKENKKLNLSGGVKTRLLVSHKDNYEGIIFEQRGLSDYRYNRLVFAPTFGIALENESPKGQTYEFGFFGNFNLNSLINKDKMWGFYNNLYPAKNIELGFTVKFFL